MIPECSQPEFGDGSSFGGMGWEFFVGWVILEGSFDPSLDLLQRWLCGASDDREATFIQWLVQVEVLPKKDEISYPGSR